MAGRDDEVDTRHTVVVLGALASDRPIDDKTTDAHLVPAEELCRLKALVMWLWSQALRGNSWLLGNSQGVLGRFTAC